MDKFKIVGGTPLSGELPVSGSKNSALPALAACLLTDEPVTLRRVPRVKDIATMESLLEYAGAKVSTKDDQSCVHAKTLDRPEAPYEVVKTMRASSLVLGPLVARTRTRPCFHARRLRHWSAAYQHARLGIGETRRHY